MKITTTGHQLQRITTTCALTISHSYRSIEWESQSALNLVIGALLGQPELGQLVRLAGASVWGAITTDGSLTRRGTAAVISTLLEHTSSPYPLDDALDGAFDNPQCLTLVARLMKKNATPRKN